MTDQIKTEKKSYKKYYIIGGVLAALLIIGTIASLKYYRWHANDGFRGHGHGYWGKRGDLGWRGGSFWRDHSGLKWEMSKRVLSDDEVWKLLESLRGHRTTLVKELEKENFQAESFNKLFDQAQSDLNKGLDQVQGHLQKSLGELSLEERQQLSTMLEERWQRGFGRGKNRE